MVRISYGLSSALLAVAEYGSFEVAAEGSSVTRSAVSQRIKTLERQLGRVLITRTKPARLTKSGGYVPVSDSYLSAVAAGLGWGMVPDVLVPHVPPDSVVDLVPGACLRIGLYWQRRRIVSAPLAALSAEVMRVARQNLS